MISSAQPWILQGFDWSRPILKKNQVDIKNREHYLNSMRKSMLDKVFFIDKIFEPVSTIVDFGCADGSLIGFLQELFPEYSYIGYDNDSDMIKIAQNSYKNCSFYTDLKEITLTNDSLLNLSSVVHEIYSYCDKEAIQNFWNYVFNSGFKYISFRDMMLDGLEDYFYDAVKIEKITDKYSYAFEEYQNVWGKVKSNADFIHFLYKSKYVYGGNWERELHENYIPIDYQDMIRFIPDNYEIVYQNHYIFPYLAYWVKREFDIDLHTPTHLQLLLKRRNNK